MKRKHLILAKILLIDDSPKKENWFATLWKSNKDFFLPILGGIITLGATLVSNHYNNVEVFQKEFREKRETFVDDYFKKLYGRYSLFDKLVDDDGISKKDGQITIEISNYKGKLEDARTEIGTDSAFNASQFRRFSLDKFLSPVIKLDFDMDDAIQFSESKKHNQDTLRDKQVEFKNRISLLQKKIYAFLDSHQE